MPISAYGVRAFPRLGMRWSTALLLILVVAALLGGAVLVGARLFQHSPLPAGRLGQLAYGLDGDIYLADWDGKHPVKIADGTPRSQQRRSECVPWQLGGGADVVSQRALLRVSIGLR